MEQILRSFEGSLNMADLMTHVGTRCNVLQRTAAHCNALQRTATHCNTLQYAATYCNTLQHTATHCNTLHHTATKQTHPRYKRRLYCAEKEHWFFWTHLPGVSA